MLVTIRFLSTEIIIKMLKYKYKLVWLHEKMLNSIRGHLRGQRDRSESKVPALHTAEQDSIPSPK